MCQLIRPIYGRTTSDLLPLISAQNPIEMLDALDVKPGQYDLYIAYAGKDQFNIAAHVESFLEVAKRRKIEVEVGYEPNGKHNKRTALKLWPGIADWLALKLTPYAPK